MIIRQLTESDGGIFKTLRLHALKTEPDKFSSNYERESAYTDSEWQGWLGNEINAFFGLFDNGNLIGITGIVRLDRNPQATEAILVASYLLPAYRRQGLSRKLYQARLDWAASQPGLKQVRVSHRESNEASRRAHQAFGFIFSSKEMMEWPDGLEENQASYLLDLDSYRSRP